LYFCENQRGVTKPAWKLLQPIIILHLIIISGVAGYMAIEHFNLVEAIYMTTISVTTTGFTEVHPLSPAGRLFTVFLLVTSWTALAFAVTRITQYVISGEVNKYFKTRRIMSSIEKISGHVIICGYGRNGQQAAQILQYHNQPFVVIEQRQDLIDHIIPEKPQLLYLVGDGTDDEILKKAGIERARALITALPTDAHNVFIVLSARSLNPNIQIISRASENSSYPKLIKAGANHVIMPDRIGGTHMATLISKPDVVEFIDFLASEEGESIHIESVDYNQLPPEIRDKSLQNIMAWKKTGVNCIGIKTADGKFVISPPESTVISAGMKVLVLGNREQISEMKGNIEKL
jgi:voltage-gated potassium channel